MDESSLMGNLKDHGILDFSHHLTGDQLALFVFLIVQRAIVSVLGSSEYAARLLPLLCGIAALFMFARLVGALLSAAGRDRGPGAIRAFRMT